MMAIYDQYGSNMASKKSCKTLMILQISLKRPPDGLTYAIDIKKQIYQ